MKSKEALVHRQRGFMSRLHRHRGGNVLVMMAVALIPVAGFAGAAIDTSRLYFVKVRLQQACDAGALAGRKFMTGTTYTTEANSQAEKFFSNNFRNGYYGTTSISKQFIKTVNNQVTGTAQVTVPMAIMSMFGIAPVKLSVACEAKLEIPNLDVMFVLDTTGSMGDSNPGDTVNRISALRTAVGNFYDTLANAKTNAARIRYGFVPYSSTVNVGMLLQRDWMADTWTYQSREPADITTKTSTSTESQYITTAGPFSDVSGNIENYTTYGSPENCTAPSDTYKITWVSSSWTSNGDGSESQTVTDTITGSDYSSNLSNGVCTITEKRYNNYVRRRVDTRRPNPKAGQQTTTTSNVYWWRYAPIVRNVSGFKGGTGSATMKGGSVNYRIGGGNGSAWTDASIKWDSSNACIEERQTVRQNAYSPIPSNAYDLDIDMVPTPSRPETQWGPWLPGLVYARSLTDYNSPTSNTTAWPATSTTDKRYNGNYVRLSGYPNDYAACPSPSMRLNTISKSDLTSYLNGLKVAGRTYHDIGFLWGMRLLSPTGLFASDNSTAPNGSQIARNIIFMTDGDTETNFADYDSYGLAGIDRRRTPANRLPSGNGEQDTIVENRLTALCRAAQGRDVTVWVIAFGTTLTPLLDGCASPGNHAFQANNAAELNSAFAQIAANIAKLRISK